MSALPTPLAELLADAGARGVRFSLDGERLLSQAPPGAIDAELGARIRALREPLRAHLEQQAPPRLQHRDEAGPRALSCAEERFVFIDQLDGGSPQYNMPLALRLRGAFDADAIEAALQSLVARHAPLRTCYPADGGAQPHPLPTFALRREDLSGLPPPARDAALQQAVTDDAGRAFDLGRDLLLRGSLVRLGTDDAVLLLCTHHIAADGWSFLVLEQEFVHAYGALRHGKAPALPALEIDYADYVRWQRAWLASAAGARDADYWRTQLAGLPMVHALPTDRPRPPQQSFAGARHGVLLPQSLYARLQQLARDQRCTGFMLLHAAFALLLGRWSHATDLVLGTPVMNRREPALEALVGCFVNTLVLRLDCAGAESFRELLARAREVNLDAQQHQDLPFDRLVELLRPARSAAHPPLFQIMLSLGMPEPASRPQLRGLQVDALVAEGTSAKFDLGVYATESPDGLWLDFEYATALFDAPTIERLARHFVALLEQLPTQLDAPLASLRLEPVTAFGSETGSAKAPRLDVAIATYAQQHPRAPALVAPDGTLDYATLDARAAALARALVARGVLRGDRVALCLPRGCARLIAMLATWKAGAVYLPLEPAHPPARRAQLLADAQAVLLLLPAGEGVSAGVPTLALPAADGDWTFAAHAGIALDAGGADDVAYVIYTSGSTGRPKGVPITHANLAHLDRGLKPWLDAIGVPSAPRWAWNASYAFDASLQAMLQLARGACLVLPDEALRRDPVALRAWLAQECIDVLDATPLQVEALLDVPGGPLPRLVIGGEAITPALWQRIAQRCPQQALNVYGPTEATVDATAARIDGDAPTIGEPLAGVRACIVDRHGSPQPDGLPGELWLGGGGLASGYLGDPELSATRFVTDPPGLPGRWYRSGDVVRRRADGRLEFLGRADAQLKLRGHRIEPAEIEHALRALPGVREAVVDLRDGGTGAQLVAWLVAAETPADDAAWLDECRAGVRALLPESMRPTRWQRLDALPQTTNGKLDRAALALPAPIANAATLPSSAAERVIAALFGDALGLAPIGLDDDFFVLGGHSILAARLVARLASTFRRPLALRLFFERPSVAGVRAALAGDDPVALERVAEIYLQIAALSPDEVTQRLAQAEGGA